VVVVFSYRSEAVRQGVYASDFTGSGGFIIGYTHSDGFWAGLRFPAIDVYF
jgi:hypothetical protein